MPALSHGQGLPNLQTLQKAKQPAISKKAARVKNREVVISSKNRLIPYHGTAFRLKPTLPVWRCKMSSLNAKSSLMIGAMAAIGASLCCLGPLLLLSLGIGGAWISGLTALQPFRPLFV